MPHKSVYLDTVAALQNKILAANAVQNAKWKLSKWYQSRGKREQRDEVWIRCRTIVTRSCNEISTALNSLDVVTRAEDTETLESRMAHIHEKIKPTTVESAMGSYEDNLQSRDLDLNEGLKSAMFNFAEHCLTEVVHASWYCIFNEMQPARLVLSKWVVEPNVKSIFSSTTLIVPMADIVWKLVNNSSEH